VIDVPVSPYALNGTVGTTVAAAVAFIGLAVFAGK